MRNFAYVLPETIDQAAAAAKEKGALLKAGGIDLLDLMKGEVVQPESLVNLLHLKAAGLREIASRDDGLHIGALVTLGQLAGAGAVPGVLAQAAGLAATPQIRNVATVGGNLAQRVRCWWFRSATFPCARKEGNQCYAQKGENKYHAIFDNGDCAAVNPSSLAAPLVALDATVVTSSRRIPIADFFVPTGKDITREHVLERGEIITEIFVPKAARGWRAAYREASERDSSDWSTISAAVTLDLDGKTVKAARVVLGQVAVVPLRAAAVEEALSGKPVTLQSAAAAADRAFAQAKPFEENAYKIPLGKVLLKRAILAAAGLPEMSGG
jgi:xanthine dehydrogenase YagS FAD-binding subunit